MSHCFTAVFEPCLINGKTELLRHNTRLWFKRPESPSFEGTCVGAVVGLNPGSAKGDAEIGRETLGNCDPTMDRILTTFEIAFKLKGLPVPEGAYVQMLNLCAMRARRRRLPHATRTRNFSPMRATRRKNGSSRSCGLPGASPRERMMSIAFSMVERRNAVGSTRGRIFPLSRPKKLGCPPIPCAGQRDSRWRTTQR